MMARFITMDIVFYAGSLNYDQGAGNYQELKKITKWDGKQYTFVSRYALRYSLLETGKRMGLWKIAEGDKLKAEGKGEQKVIQPAEELLYSGKILAFPEFDLFGYLITSTTPQNFREAPVKLSHAISLTPFNYDVLFNANIGLANRMRKLHGDMKPNPFTCEEHMTYYLYSVIIDVDSIGVLESYFQLKGEEKKNLKAKVEDGFMIIVQKEKNGKEKEIRRFRISKGDTKLEEIILPLDQNKIEFSETKGITGKVKFNPESEVIIAKYRLNKVGDRVRHFLKAILNLHRSIKGRDEDLSPKLLVLGVYNNTPYRTYKDSISLVDEQTEEEYDEIEEKPVGDKRTVRVKHVTVKSKKPVFRIKGLSGECGEINESKVLEAINHLFNNDSATNKPKEKNKSSEAKDEQQNQPCEVKVFCAPGIEVRLDDKTSKSS